MRITNVIKHVKYFLETLNFLALARVIFIVNDSYSRLY